MSVVFKVGDTYPSVDATLELNDVVLDLTDATVEFYFAYPNGTVLWHKPATVVEAEAGRVRYDWATEDLPAPGDYLGEFLVTFPSTKQATVPNNTYLNITVYKPLRTEVENG